MPATPTPTPTRSNGLHRRRTPRRRTCVNRNASTTFSPIVIAVVSRKAAAYATIPPASADTAITAPAQITLLMVMIAIEMSLRMRS